MIEGVSDRLIVALDFPDARAALALVDRLEGAVSWFKVGLELYIAEGNALISELQRRGFSVFLDLKLHDIPNTVASAVRAASRLGVKMLTVHASGGPAMLAAAAEAAGTGLDLLAVTVLTSMDTIQLEATGVPANPAEQVEKLATLAFANGIRGFVCSPMEVANLRSRFGPKPLLVTPGIRPDGSEPGDQRRMATPAAAMTAGASYLVVGRPISRAADPAAAAKSIVVEMQTAVVVG
ncbi:MAG TPA: orotidine-5'-phosphate decarboxylase [Acidobacteriaceae bacterium]|nr:orotidine-5'-phosphate decarboxylase [Acidobacteriaceae bacterium]